MTGQSHIIVWTAGASAKLAVCVAAALFFGGCTSNVDGFLPLEPGGTRPATVLQYSILGSVRAETAEGEVPVEGAEVVIARGSGSLSAITDAEGRFALGGVAAGRWSLAIQKEGYRAVTAEVDLSDTTSLDFVLAAQDGQSQEAQSEDAASENDESGCGTQLRDCGSGEPRSGNRDLPAARR
jgi:hypothetical protein